jgi:hypothetical protein
MSSKLKDNHNLSAQNQSFKVALTTLRNKSKIDIETIQSDINELKEEVRLLEKQRRQARGLLLDLSYGLQQDCDHMVLKGKEIASSAQLEVLELETAKRGGDQGDDGMRRNTPVTVRLTSDMPLSSQDNGGGAMVSVVSSKRRDLETDNYYTGGANDHDTHSPDTATAAHKEEEKAPRRQVARTAAGPSNRPVG